MPSLRHLQGRHFTCTEIQLSKINRSLFLIPHSLCEAVGDKETDRTSSELLGLDNHPCAYGNNRVASLSIALRKSLRYDSTIKMYFVPSHWTPGCGCELSMAMVQFFLTKYSCARPQRRILYTLCFLSKS